MSMWGGPNPGGAAPAFGTLPPFCTQRGFHAISVRQGDLLTVIGELWAGTGITFVYQWFRDDVAIAGATAATYTLVAADRSARIRRRTIATNATGAGDPAWTDATDAVKQPKQPPVAVVAPVILGQGQVGRVMSITDGAYLNGPIVKRRFGWLRNGTLLTGDADKIGTRTAAAADEGTMLIGRQWIEGPDGVEVVVDTAAIGPIAASGQPAAGDPPTVVSTPTLPGGTPQVGLLLTAATGSYAGSPVIIVARQWQRRQGAGWENIAAATALAYSPLAGDVGWTLRLRETATNDYGEVIAYSGESAAVTASAVEAAITSVAANGLFLTMASAPASARPDYSVAVGRTGYNGAGVLAPWTEQLRLPARRNTPGLGNANFTPTDVVPERVIFAGDTFVNQPTVVNNSTRTPPSIEARWITRGFRCVGNSDDPFELVVWSPYFRDGTYVARVEFVWSDQHGNSVVVPATLTKWIGPRSGLCVSNLYRSSALDYSTLTDGDRIDVNYRLYGHYGQLIDSSAPGFVGNVAANRGFDVSGTLFLYKRAAMAAARVYAYINPSASGGAASLDPAVAAAAPFPTLSAARTAAMALNNSTYGINAIDGCVFRWIDTGATLVVNVVTGDLLAINCGARFEPDPAGTWATRPTFAAANFKFSSASSALPDAAMGHYVRGFDFQWASGSQIIGATSTSIRVYVDDGQVDVNSATDTVNFSNAGCVVRNMRFFNFGTAGQNMLRTLGGVIDVVVENSTKIALIGAHCMLGLKAVNARLTCHNNTRAWFGSGLAVDGALASSGATSPIHVSDSNTARVQGGVNLMIANLDADEENNSTFSADGAAYDFPNGFMLHQLTYPCKAYAPRLNSFYNETIAQVRTQRFCGYYGSIIPTVPSKGDWFCNVDAAFISAYPDAGARLTVAQGREEGWAEHGYGIGGGNNWQQWCSNVPEADNATVRYRGVNSKSPLAQQTGLPVVYLDSRVATVTGGAAGTPGGNYRTLSTLDAPYRAAVPWDLDGNSIPALATIPGAYAGYVG